VLQTCTTVKKIIRDRYWVYSASYPDQMKIFVGEEYFMKVRILCKNSLADIIIDERTIFETFLGLKAINGAKNSVQNNE
jgi:hypothetical protein